MRSTGRRQTIAASTAAIGHHPSFKHAGNELRHDRFEDVQNMRVLHKMKEVFEAAVQAGGMGELDMDTFSEKFAGMLSYEGSDSLDALRTLFKRIDVNSDGHIDWDEFSTFMLLENQGAARMRETETTLAYVRGDLHEKMPDVEGHREPMTRILWLPSGMGNEKDRYITGGKDGTIRFWNSVDLTPQRTVTDGTAWVTDIVYMPHTSRLAACTFNRTVKLYDIGSMEVCGGASDLEVAPFTIDSWYNNRLASEFVAVGDVGGNCMLYEVVERPEEDKNSDERFGMSRLWKAKTHKDWVSKVLYLPDMNAVVSASLDSTMAVTDVETGREQRKLIGHTKGVFTMDWSKDHKFVVSGGMDRNILIWNPYASKAMANIGGHNATVSQVLVNDHENQIITLSVDKCIKVWDIRNHRCLQTISDATKYRPEDQIASLLYDPNKKWLLTGTTKLRTWPLKSTTTNAASGHKAPVLAGLFSFEFKEVISGDVDGVICVWNTYTGKLRFRFQGIHGAERVVAVTLDSNGRRLITAAESGEIKVWNYSSGFCLKPSKNHPNSEITALVSGKGMYSGNFLISVGWDRKVTFFEDSDGRDLEVSRQLTGHRSDILTANLSPAGTLLATGSDDGSAFLWSVESGSVKHKLKSPLPGQEPASVEQVMFLRDRLSFVLATLTADGLLQLWNSATGVLLLQRLVPRPGPNDTCTCMAVSTGSKFIAIGDSSGYVLVYDASRFDPTKYVRHPQAAQEVLVPVHYWRAHRAAVNSMSYIVTAEDAVPSTTEPTRANRRRSVALPAAASGEFFLSCGQDTRLTLWRMDGTRIGSFGIDTWIMDDRSTWASPPKAEEGQVPPPDGFPPESLPFPPEVSTDFLPPTYGSLLAPSGRGAEEEAKSDSGSDFEGSWERENDRPGSHSDAPVSAGGSMGGWAPVVEWGDEAELPAGLSLGLPSGRTTGGVGSRRRSRQEGGGGGRDSLANVRFGGGSNTGSGVLGRPSFGDKEQRGGKKGGSAASALLHGMTPLAPPGSAPIPPRVSISAPPAPAPQPSDNDDPPLEVVIEDFARRRRPAVRPLHERVYIPARDEDRKINFPDGSGRPQSSVHHLIYIQDLRELEARPSTSYEQQKRGKDKIHGALFGGMGGSTMARGGTAGGKPGGGGAAAGAAQRPATAMPALGTGGGASALGGTGRGLLSSTQGTRPGTGQRR